MDLHSVRLRQQRQSNERGKSGVYKLSASHTLASLFISFPQGAAVASAEHSPGPIIHEVIGSVLGLSVVVYVVVSIVT